MTAKTNVSILWPSGRSSAIEERYAAAFSRMRIIGDSGAPIVAYHVDETASDVARRVKTDAVIVVTEDTLLPPSGLTTSLLTLLARTTSTAVVPTTAESPEPAQRATTFEPYLALGQFDEQAALIEASDRDELDPFEWGAADPGIFATRTDTLARSDRTLARLLEGETVDIARRLFAHRFIALRGQPRQDLLDRIPLDASRVLEFGCGEGALAAALKARQACRVVGVELDPEASRIAETRLDRLVSGDVRELLPKLDETFDFAIGGDIVEHLDDPWDFLRGLGGVMEEGGRLLLSLPNLACWAIVQDLMRGRFDYVYIGITCVGHLRFFTRRTIEEMLTLSGWTLVSIEPQPEFRTPGYDRFIEGLGRSGLPCSEADLLAPGYYVIAEWRNG
jgi:SAM-dependent methyltransferase